MKKFVLSLFALPFLTIAINAQTIFTATNVQIVTTAGTEVVIEGGASFETGTTVNNNGTITLRPNAAAGAENWTNNTGGSFLTGTGLVNMRGNANQSIIGNNSFYALRCDNGNKVIYTGTTPLNITNQLYLDGDTKLQLPAGVSANVTNPAISAVSTNYALGFTDELNKNFVLGRLLRNTNTTAGEYIFPIGKEVGARFFYAPVRFTRATMTNPINYYAEYFFVKPFDWLNMENPPVRRVSGVEYWNIASDLLNPADDDVTLTLSYRDSSYANATAIVRDSLLIVNYTDRGPGLKWNPEGAPNNYAVVTGNFNFGYITANAFTGNYNTDLFTIGSRSFFNILPVSNINWSVAINGNTVYPNWQVYNEQAVVKYIVERSTDGINFTTMATVNSGRNLASNTYRVQDPTSLTSCVYYRLKLIDDRDRIYTMPIKKVCGGNANYSFKLYPNPAQNEVYLQTPASTNGYKIIITDATGRTMAVKNTHSATTQVINIALLANGTYHLQAIENNEVVFKKLFIKQ